jgi:predicted unusual protein kinase regulating ubiquinone biosynthesis (AarF/ABC1/UbiB family)
MAQEENSLGGRVRRYARVSGAVGGLAARLAGERFFGLELDRGAHAADLRRALGGLKGPLMKVAQILSTIPEALPREYVQELGQLQADAPAMGWPFAKRRMAGELGRDWQDKFKSFEHQAAAAASLGQVHRAVGLDGSALACKLQYPEMRAAVEADLKQLKLIFTIYRRYDKSIDPSNIHTEIAARLREELDYRLEARHTELYRRMLADVDGVHVPAVVEALSSDRLLTMTWLEGQRLLRYKDAPQADRNMLARRLFHAWYIPFYNYGVIHGDPHLGNYSVAEDLSLNLLDFGCIRTFQPKFVQGVIDLYHAILNGDEALAIHAYETWGFSNLDRSVIDALNIWAEFVYAPLLEDRVRPIQEFATEGVYGQDVAAKVHRQLRELGGVTPPREFVFMDRAAIGLGGVFLHLDATLNWHDMFNEMIDGFDAAALAARQDAALGACGVPVP